MVKGYKNEARCAACGGLCCRIYKKVSEGGSMPDNERFEEWTDLFHLDRKLYGVQPLFAPLEAHGDAATRKEYLAKGIDIDCCEYLSPSGTGCMIPREKRPYQCLEFMCEAWKADISAKKKRKKKPIVVPYFRENETYSAEDVIRLLPGAVTVSDLKDVAEWLRASEITFTFQMVPVGKLEKQIKEMIATFDEFPEDRERADKIRLEIESTGAVYPLYIEHGDDHLFVLEGRHRMCTFYSLDLNAIPVLFASKVK